VLFAYSATLDAGGLVVIDTKVAVNVASVTVPSQNKVRCVLATPLTPTQFFAGHFAGKFDAIYSLLNGASVVTAVDVSAVDVIDGKPRVIAAVADLGLLWVIQPRSTANESAYVATLRRCALAPPP